MAQSTAALRNLWKHCECNAGGMTTISFGPDKIKVAPETVDAWRALEAVIIGHGYQIRTQDTDSYNCRAITGGAGRSLHSYGIALDVNWTTNPYIDHQGNRAVKFSSKPTQAARALDVKRALADTDMTATMIIDVNAIKTKAGIQVFEWGGSWNSVKDCMHFELDVSPAELAAGIDWDTVSFPTRAPGSAPPATNRFVVTARDGLRLRTGPGQEFAATRTYPTGTVVTILARTGDWAQVDLLGDGLADGYMHAGFLRAE
jgi:hypothetical protein